MGLKNTSPSSTQSWADYYTTQAKHCQDPTLQRFYATGLVSPDTPIGEVPLMALDFETTGMNAAKHDIVSIGMVPFTLQRIRPAQGHYWVVKPRRSLREESIVHHRITHSEIEHAPDLETVLDEVLDRLAGHLVVVHYRNIERNFLDGAIFARRGEHCLFPVIDTMVIEARFERGQRFQTLKRLFGIAPPSIRLAASRERYGLPPYSTHHAKVDALATAELLQAQIARHYSPQTPVSELWA
ncbi:3'-5' exonuclease [Thiomicrospira sp. WB1]|uniref:3'-5' exonuclease n=1 Tax=Thiomicrospira sp. WB1 TaxID=1685380 RepID=UPI000746DF4D|nr:3'-5' exonuclease [Thiomicrospira sp. WB1]KUJ71315.1 DNA polymerase III subunit epsilon [Thiomicrospira sp. WB1]